MGGLLYIVSFNIFPAFKDVVSQSVAIGASASVMAVVIAIAAYVPDYTVNLLLFGRIKIKYMALAIFLLTSVMDFSTNAGGTNASAFARASVSKILTDQLNQFTSGGIKGFNLDVNLSSSQDYFDGISSTRTDLNLGLSKAFFNDKVEIKVGRNFELENNTKITRNPAEVFDNLMLNYKLGKDGKFLFKAFRKNQFQSVLEGFIVETGVGFSIAKDYGKLGDLFRRKEEIINIKK